MYGVHANQLEGIADVTIADRDCQANGNCTQALFTVLVCHWNLSSAHNAQNNI